MNPNDTHNSIPADWWVQLFQPTAPQPSMGHVLDVTSLATKVQRIIHRFFGGRVEQLNAAQVSELLAGDLRTIQYVGPVKAQQVKEAVIGQLRRTGGKVHVTIPATAEPSELSRAERVRRIWNQRLLPTAAADELGVGVAEARAEIERSAETDKAAARLHRAWTWVDLIEEGHTLEEIGAEFDVTRERVRQVLGQFGVNARRVRTESRERRVARRAELAASADKWVRSFPGIIEHEARHVLGAGPDDFDQVIRPVQHLVLQPADADEVARLDERRTGLIASMRQAAAISSPLTCNAYEQMVADEVVPGPGKQTVLIVFGSWTAGCDAAGVDHGQRIRDDYERVWADDQIDRTVLDYLLDPDHTGTTHGYEEWAQDRDVPSLALIRQRRIGSWQEATRRALWTARNDWANSGDVNGFGDWMLAG